MTHKYLNWLKLDNSAKLYPVLVTRYTQSLFRVSIYLKEKVDNQLLEQALNDIMPRFPSFNVRLRRGLFWYFLEENTVRPKVFLDDGIVLKKIHTRINRHFLFSVLYYNNRISIEFFHAITDGLGGAEFLKALAYRYYILKGYDMSSDDNIIHLDKEFDPKELEDSFNSNYKKLTFKEFKSKTMGFVKGDNAHRIRGSYYELPGYGIIEGIVDGNKLLEVARQRNMSITSYLGAAFLLSVLHNTDIQTFKALTVMIPINLRRTFNSKTLRNFVLFSRGGIREANDPMKLTLEDFARAIETDLKKDTTPEILLNRLCGMVYIEKMWLMRILPLPLKYFFFKIGKLFVRQTTHTAILSNLGLIKMPKSLEERIEGMSININVVKTCPVSIGVATAGGKARIMFTSMIRERKVLRGFFNILRDDGLDIEVQSNMREDSRYVL